MPEEKKPETFAPEVEKTITEATSSEQIRDIVAGVPRDAKTGQFVSPAAVTTAAAKTEEKKDDAEPVVYKDTFFLGAKEVEFTGDSPADVLKQFKAAQQAYQMALPKEEIKVEAPKPAMTDAELAALGLRMANGDAKAIDEYVAKSGLIDRRLQELGFDPDRFKTIAADHDSQNNEKLWNTAVADFLASTPWPGGERNKKILGQMMKEIRNEKGVPLSEIPGVDSLKRAYRACVDDDLLFTKEEEEARSTKRTTPEVEAKTEPAATTTGTATTATTTTPKRQPTGSTAFGTSQEATVRKTAAAAPKAPEIAPDDTPQEIMRKFKESALAGGQSPDDVLRGAYSGRTQ